MKSSAVAILFLALTVSSCGYLGPSDPVTTLKPKLSKPSATLASLDFATLSREVLEPRCLHCHVGLRTEGGFRAKAADIQFAVFEEGSMPPPRRGPLTDCQLEILREYLEKGEQRDKTVGDLDACKTQLN